jgi:beta-glucosidase
MTTPTDPRLAELLGTLSLEEKVLLLTGRDFWTTWPLEKIGLRRMLLSDGPSGVRGEFWDERDPSLNLPSGTALSASWDRAMASRYGAAAAVEARRKEVDVVLGPTINLHRSPLGGRHFEAFSEDPILTGDLAAAYVTGVQQNGVAATPKHYIANDYETDRFTANTVVDERTLRELYLAAFEKTVTEAHAWALMSSYNSINGVTASENELLETPLNSEWGFDGVVVSDWTGVRSIDSAKASQDLAMPGPDGAWGDALVAAVHAGDVDESAVDRKVLRMLTLAARVGALDGFDAEVPTPVHVENGVDFAREAEAAGMVLVKNDGLLPLDRPARIAVIGHSATVARVGGGGSATVIPEKVVSPLDGVREAFPDAEISYSVGAVVQSGIAELDIAELVNPYTGDPGVRTRFLGEDGTEIFAEDRRSTALVWIGSGAPVQETTVLELSTSWTPSTAGRVLLGFAAVGHARVFVDDQLLFEETAESEGDDLGAALLSPGTRSHPFDVEAGRSYALRFEYRREVSPQFASSMTFTFGLDATDSDSETLLAEAERAAASADVVVLVVGTNSTVESEGFDRTTLDLPGEQNALAARVLAANPHTVLIVNSGSPVVLPFADEAGAILLAWFGGQEMGSAIGDVLTGAVEPGGRLPTTWPIAQADVPVIDVTPVNGEVHYTEGIHIGYRAWLKAGVEPRWWFGHGLGYTTWSLANMAADATSVSIDVTNSGTRRGKHVVQVYASRAESSIDRPVRWLVGFATVVADASETVRVQIPIERRSFEHWDGGWQLEPGEFTLAVGSSVVELPLSTTVSVGS